MRTAIILFFLFFPLCSQATVQECVEFLESRGTFKMEAKAYGFDLDFPHYPNSISEYCTCLVTMKVNGITPEVRDKVLCSAKARMYEVMGI